MPAGDTYPEVPFSRASVTAVWAEARICSDDHRCRQSDVDGPGIGSSEVDGPAIGSSEVDGPGIGSSEVDGLAIGSSEVDGPGIRSSEVDGPGIVQSFSTGGPRPTGWPQRVPRGPRDGRAKLK